MKALANGALHLSTRDGWWAEAFEPGLGWSIGQEWEDPDLEHQDAADASHLYELLEREIVPLYYDRGPDGIPRGWVARVKQSLRRLAPRFHANRMVRRYVEEGYLPAARRYHTLTCGGMTAARSLLAWKERVRGHWDEVQIEGVSCLPEEGTIRFRARVRLGELPPDDVAVQAYADPTPEDGEEAAPLVIALRRCGTQDHLVCYEGCVATRRPARHFTVRGVPWRPNARQLEADRPSIDLPLVRRQRQGLRSPTRGADLWRTTDG